MARKSNKTAHVLNLLAGHDAAKETDEQQASAEQNTSDDTTGQASPGTSDGAVQSDGADTAAGQAVSSNTAAATGNIDRSAVTTPAAAPAPAPAAPSPNNIAMIDKTEDDPVAELIQQKLSSEFEKQIHESAPALQAELSIEEAAPAPQTEAQMQEETSVPQTEAQMQGETSAPQTEVQMQEESPASQTEVQIQGETPAPQKKATEVLQTDPPISEAPPTSVEENVPVQEDVSSSQKTDTGSAPESFSAPEPEPEPESDFAAVNVMEHIVNDKIIYFMRQFDVCTCSRCKADVAALTLNGLMPKYIVTMKAAVDPLLSYYTNRLISDVTVEATKACMVVKENPRH